MAIPSIPPLSHELEGLSAPALAKLRAHGFDPAWFLSMAAPLREAEKRGLDAASERIRRQQRNRVAGPARAPESEELLELPEPGSAREAELVARGLEAIGRGEVALCVMSGGMATRMGGVVKALEPVYDARTFLEHRLAEARLWRERTGRTLPLWLMTSDATRRPIEEALEAHGARAFAACFDQGLGVRLTPTGHVFLDANGEVQTYATGHGDLVDALRTSGLLHRFVEGGGKVVMIANLDNLGATIDPLLVGLFLERREACMVEVVEKEGTDRGGIPVHAAGKLQVLEEFRLPEGFDPSTVRVFNTNTFHVDARTLLEVPIQWNWCEVEKKVQDQTVIQFERLLQELTAATPSSYVRVPRTGPRGRFLPVKDFAELERRKPEIREVLEHRGIAR
jgi:UTP--glucose-1-phosphate uridylyltransferase